MPRSARVHTRDPGPLPFRRRLHRVGRRRLVGRKPTPGRLRITPIISILHTTLQIETESRFTRIYADRSRRSTMFRHELDELESTCADRLRILHVFSDESPASHPPELKGQIDLTKLDLWFATIADPATVDEWSLGGPAGLTTMVRDALLERSVAAERIHLELFTGYRANTTDRTVDRAPATATMKLNGSTQTFELAVGESLLEGAHQKDPNAPYSCMGGACGTCRAKILAGRVEMYQNFALGPSELESGYVLTCQAHPAAPTVSFDCDVQIGLRDGGRPVATDRLGGDGPEPPSSSGTVRSATPGEPTGPLAGVCVVASRLDTVYECGEVALGGLQDPARPGRQVVAQLRATDPEGFEVDHVEIGALARRHGTPVIEPVQRSVAAAELVDEQLDRQ